MQQQQKHASVDMVNISIRRGLLKIHGRTLSQHFVTDSMLSGTEEMLVRGMIHEPK